MPASMSKDPSGKGYQVSTPNGVHGSKMTLRNAKAQQRLLNALDHGWRPNRKGSKDGKDGK